MPTLASLVAQGMDIVITTFGDASGVEVGIMISIGFHSHIPSNIHVVLFWSWHWISQQIDVIDAHIHGYFTDIGTILRLPRITVTSQWRPRRLTGVSIVYSTFCLSADQRNYQSSASLAFVRGIHRWPVNSPHKGPVTRKMFPFDDVIMNDYCLAEGVHTLRPRQNDRFFYRRHSQNIFFPVRNLPINTKPELACGFPS